MNRGGWFSFLCDPIADSCPWSDPGGVGVSVLLSKFANRILRNPTGGSQKDRSQIAPRMDLDRYLGAIWGCFWRQFLVIVGVVFDFVL